MADFYITLPSNTIYPGNTTASFTVPLPKPIHLEGEWECALAQITYPRTWLNMYREYFKVFFKLPLKSGVMDFDYTYTIPDGYYKSSADIIRAIVHEKDQIWTFLREDYKDDPTWLNLIDILQPSAFVFHHEKNGKVRLELDDQYVTKVEFSPGIEKALGFRENSSGVASHFPTLDKRVQNLFLYTSIIQPQLIGDHYSQVLKIIPVTGAVGTIHDIHYTTLHYCNVLSRDFNEISINIRDSLGFLVPFEDDSSVIVKIHFRRKRPEIY